MKKIGIFYIILLLVVTFNSPIMAQESGNQKIILQGGVEVNVPRTPEEITAYLQKMKLIMNEYDALSQTLMVSLMMGNRSQALADNARNEWIRLANKIDSIVPPQELRDSHKRLASSLRKTNSFLMSSTGTSADQKQQMLTTLTPVVTDLMFAANYYSNGVGKVISDNRLDPSLNPLQSDGGFNTGGLNIDLNSLQNMNLNNLGQ